MILNFVAAAPLDHPAPVRVDAEVVGMIRAAEAAHTGVQFRGQYPSSIRSIQRRVVEPAERGILHVSAHAHANGIELERDDGTAECSAPAAFVEALRLNPPALLFLCGCRTEPVASRIHGALSSAAPWIVSTRRDITDGEANEFTEAFYSRLFRDGDVAAAFGEAAHSRPGWQLHPGDGTISMRGGEVLVDVSLLSALNWIGTLRSIVPRTREMAAIYAFLRETSPALLICGAPRSGVSLLLRVAAARFAWMFERPAVSIDLAGLSTSKFLEVLAIALGTEPVPSIADLLEPTSALICLDNLDRAEAPLSRDLLAAVQLLNARSRARLLIGTTADDGLPAVGRRPLVVSALTDSEAQAYLTRELDRSEADRLSPILPRINKLPGRLVDLVDDVRNGATNEEILQRQDAGDPRAGLARLLARLMNDRRALRHLQVFYAAGFCLPRTVAAAAFSAGAQQMSVADFEGGLRRLRGALLVRVEPVLQTPQGLQDPYLICSTDFGSIMNEQLRNMSPTDREEIASVAISMALDRARRGVLSAANDGQWVVRAVESAASAGLHEQAMELGGLILGKGGAFRSSQTPDTLALAALFRGAAALRRNWDLAGYFSLFLGEKLYSAGRLGEAEAAFRACLSSEAPNSRRLQVLRALGQISYRKGKYIEALQLYDEAMTVAEGADLAFVATVVHHRSKTCFRLGRFTEALSGLDDEIKRRQSLSDQRGMLKARHEQARVLQALGQTAEAERLYQLVIVGAVEAGFGGLLPAPNYQLSLLHIGLGHLDAAENYLEECRRCPEARTDPFWIAHAELANAMLEYERGRRTEGLNSLRRCLEIAQERGFEQIGEDARGWIAARLDGGESATMAMRDLVAARYPGLGTAKAEKAIRYAGEGDRIETITVGFRSSSRPRQLAWSHVDGWTCSCEYWAEKRICSHVVAVHLMSVRSLSRLLDPRGNDGN